MSSSIGKISEMLIDTTVFDSLILIDGKPTRIRLQVTIDSYTRLIVSYRILPVP